MRMSFDQFAGLQLVQDARQRDRLHVEQFRQSALVDAFVLSQIGQRLPLRSGQPGFAGNLLEPLPEQPRDFVQQKTSVGDSISTASNSCVSL
jgi:hypothetical protein